MAGPWEAYQSEGRSEGPWSAYKADPAQVPVGTTQGAPEDIGRGGALLEGYLSGASANFRDEVKGLSEASGLPGALGGFRAPVGAAKVLWEYLSKNPGEASALYEKATNESRQRQASAAEQYPGTNTAGNIAGAIATAPLMPIARAATLPGRMGAGAAVGAGYGGLSGLGEGTTNEERITKGLSGAAVGGAVGAAAPPVVEGVLQGARALGRPVISAARGIIDPSGEAARRLGTHIQSDVRADPTSVSRLTPQEFSTSGPSGPATVMDIGGDATRALARSAANTSPEGRGVLNRSINERFEGQGDRVTGWLRNTFNFPNATAQQEAIEQTAKTVNKPAYLRAYSDGDKQVWSPELERITSSPDVVSAMKEAATKGKSRAVVEGHGGFNPGVTVDNGGIVTFQKGPTGIPTYPNLQFWDYTKRALDDAGKAARRSGRDEEAATITNLSRALRSELDNIVPSYGQARAGAAQFFGAENALEAGQTFVTQDFAIPATRQALAKMSSTEKQLFQDGFVSRYIETLEKVSDRRDIVNKIQSSPAAMEKLNVALGPQRAKELEAVLRVEGIMDLARKAVQGNSTTARQLVELGLAGGVAGYGQFTGDPSAVVNAALVWGAARGHRAIDARVAQRVAEMLTSKDPQVLSRGIRMVARNNVLLNQFRSVDIHLARVGGQNAPVPAIQAPGIGRTEND